MEQFKTYIGTKIIQAKESTNYEFFGGDTKGVKPGYVVIYPDGYRSWSPKDVFEKAYRLVDGKEMELLKGG